MNNQILLYLLTEMTYFRIVVGCLGLLYSIWLYYTWKKSVRSLSTLSFYTLSKTLRKIRFVWLGLFLFTVSYILELSQDPSLKIMFTIDLLRTLGIVVISYVFYEFLRGDLARVQSTHVSTSKMEPVEYSYTKLAMAKEAKEETKEVSSTQAKTPTKSKKKTTKRTRATKSRAKGTRTKQKTKKSKRSKK